MVGPRPTPTLHNNIPFQGKAVVKRAPSKFNFFLMFFFSLFAGEYRLVPTEVAEKGS